MFPLSLPPTSDNMLTQHFDQIDTWPFVRRSRLKNVKENHTELERSHKISDKWRSASYDYFSKKLDDFRRRQDLCFPWMLTVIIGVFGNLFVSSLFGPTDLANPLLTVFSFLGLLLVTLVFFRLFPIDLNHQFEFMFPIPRTFPGGHEKYVGPQGKLNIDSQNVLSNNLLDRLVEEFGCLVSLMIVRDQLSQIQLQVSKIANVRDVVPGSRIAYPVLGF